MKRNVLIVSFCLVTLLAFGQSNKNKKRNLSKSLKESKDVVLVSTNLEIGENSSFLYIKRHYCLCTQTNYT
ncbi:hypothetical protein FHR24_000574 [Wenyingzhuangia heitensis]|uniref:Uncharacterized protein n=1 Tax=Wenyingzhuangia heitensis TaxID=1487859 RepID=A0ABX0U873_9FLAO|nr:hypothetical protein [Wenyingzhuangia heitensis]